MPSARPRSREIAGQVRPAAKAAANDADVIRSMARGEMRSFTFETRDVVKTSTGSPVPTSFYNQVIAQARLVGPMLDTSTVLRTAGGENTGTVTGEGTAIGESDFGFNSFITLGAYKYSFLVQLSRELIEDAGVDILAFLAEQTGNAIGYAVNADLTTGNGTNKPKGIVAAAGSGVLGTTAGGLFSADNLIDLAYSLDGAARRLPGVGWMMNTASLGAVRKLKDTSGRYIFEPSLADGNDRVLNYPVYENPAMASQASARSSSATCPRTTSVRLADSVSTGATTTHSMRTSSRSVRRCASTATCRKPATSNTSSTTADNAVDEVP
ncbi:MAG: phage major capsid protein [Caulobacteraceae bacterium]|nr:phage major capsid protein [Caulobacteraceae bacterium]